MSGPLTVQYEITPGAISDAMRLHRARYLRSYRVAMAAAAMVGVLVAATLDVRAGITLSVVFLLLLLTTWMGFLDCWVNRDIARGVIGGVCKFVADEQGLHYESPLCSGMIGWSALTDIRVNGKSVVFQRDRVLAAWIPAAAFVSAETATPSSPLPEHICRGRLLRRWRVTFGNAE